MRDPTRGGLATTLNELAVQSGKGILIKEGDSSAQGSSGACEMLGLDPLYLANEGKVIAVVALMRQKMSWRRCAVCLREKALWRSGR